MWHVRRPHRSNFLKVAGVNHADYDLDSQTLTIDTDKDFNETKLVSAIIMAGHDADGQKAPDDIYNNLPECCKYRPASSHDEHTDKSTPEPIDPLDTSYKLTIPVRGECGMCESRIEDTALKVIGVAFADYDLSTHLLTVEIDPHLFVKIELIKSILQAGHDADGLTAPDNICNKLPVCCKYRDADAKKHPESAQEKSRSLSGTVFEKK